LHREESSHAIGSPGRAYVPKHLHALNTAGTRGVLKQAEHLQANCAQLLVAPVTNDNVERVGPVCNIPVSLLDNYSRTHWQNLQGSIHEETKSLLLIFVRLDL